MAWGADPRRIRQDRRLAVTLPVELPSGHGMPCDVSASGVFFETTHALSPGAAIRFPLLLKHADPMGPIRPRLQEKIVRVEPLRGRLGMAVAIDRDRFDPMDASAGPR